MDDGDADADTDADTDTDTDTDADAAAPSTLLLSPIQIQAHVSKKYLAVDKKVRDTGKTKIIPIFFRRNDGCLGIIGR